LALDVCKKTNIMKINKGLTREEFRDHFGTPECLQYLSGPKMGRRIFVPQVWARQTCQWKEAFEMTFDIVTSKKGANSIWLAEKYGIKQHPKKGETGRSP